MYNNGQQLIQDSQFQDHVDAYIPVQVYYQSVHKDIGFVQTVTPHFIIMNHTYYNRYLYLFVSRSGY
jgi:hypothetical protein